jgi:hypothetical protein
VVWQCQGLVRMSIMTIVTVFIVVIVVVIVDFTL